MNKTWTDFQQSSKQYKHKWLSNNKLIFLFSFFIAVIFWIVVSFNNFSAQNLVRIDDIPINIQLSKNALENQFTVFFKDKSTARVEITGNALSASKATPSDIEVSATETEAITESGEYTLDLSAKIPDQYSELAIVKNSLKPSKITVLIDREKQEDFPVKNDIGYTVEDGFFASDPQFTPNTITVSGPESIVTEIETIEAKYNIADTLKANVSTEIPLFFYDKNHNLIPDTDLEMLTISKKKIISNITVLKKITTALSVKLLNAPTDFDYATRVTVVPNILDVALPEDDAETFSNFPVTEKDFTTLTIGKNIFSVPIQLPQGYKNLSNNSKVKITVDLSNYDQTYVSVDKFKFINIPKGLSPTTLTTSLPIRIIGRTDEINTIEPKSITAIIDLKNKDKLSGQLELPVTFKITDHNTCFVKGQYKINVML